MEIEAFLAKHKQKYEIIEHFQNLLNNISRETFPETIKYVEDHTDIFFHNRDSAILFLWNIRIFTVYNFKKLELILDVLVNFFTRIKQFVTNDNEIIDYLYSMRFNIYYIYSKNLLSIQSIIRKSIDDSSLFVYFYPEIDEYDHEYAEKKKDEFFKYESSSQLIDFFQEVIDNPEKHKKNRERNFHLSAIHKAIRDDDIESFQSILAKNNYGINYSFQFSYY